MTDASLAVFLSLSDAETAIIIPKLTPETRAVYERMAEVCVDLNMGVVPKAYSSADRKDATDGNAIPPTAT